jgi:hypothetical protein
MFNLPNGPNRWQLAALATAAALVTSAAQLTTVHASYFPPGTPASGNVSDMVLLYVSFAGSQPPRVAMWAPLGVFLPGPLVVAAKLHRDSSPHVVRTPLPPHRYMDARSVDGSEFVVTPDSAAHLLACSGSQFFDAVGL